MGLLQVLLPDTRRTGPRSVPDDPRVAQYAARARQVEITDRSLRRRIHQLEGEVVVLRAELADAHAQLEGPPA